MAASVPSNPSLATVLGRAFNARLSSVRVGLPGRVESYNPATLSCTVQPLVMEGTATEDEDRVAMRLPAINNVPVFCIGGGGMRITFPLQTGDTGWIMFASSSIDKWLALGGEVDPGDDRNHHIADAIFLPGLQSFATVTPASNSGATVIEGSDIRLGDDSGQALAFNSDLSTLISAIQTCAPAPSEPGLATVKGAVASLTVAGTTKVKAK